ncbi:L,D-transpeptidase family protein [Planctomycetota bacterium]|nr:L,D-transpeptidase family protein [Planctomycetota bacterium]
MKNVLFAIFAAAIFAGCSVNKTSVQHDTQPEPEAAVVKNTTPEVEPETAPEPEPEVEAMPVTEPEHIDAELANGKTKLEENHLREARAFLTRALSNDQTPEDEAETLELLTQINEKLFMSTEGEGDLELYTVKRGDTLGKIAIKFNTTWEMIQRINGLKTTSIRVDQKLKILGGEFELIVRKERNIMDLLLNGNFIQRYEVGLGVDDSTPLGIFTVKNRIPKPADGSYAYGHAKHRLGKYWLGLKSDAGHKGYGIHGCPKTEEKLIGTQCSKGCVRMRDREIEEIYEIIPVGTRVKVVAS